MARIETWYSQDLKQAVKVRYIDGNVFSADNQGNVVGVIVTDEGEAATLSGTVSASIIRADGVTVAATGTLSGNKVSVALPQSAYAVPGVLSVVVKLTSESDITTLLAVVGNVYRSTTDSIVDPGTIIPSIETLIAEIEAAVASIPADYSDLWTSLAPSYSTSNTYTVGQYVTYNGGLYRCVIPITSSESWTASHWFATTLGTGIAENKNEADYDYVRQSITWVQGGFNVANGANTTSTNRIKTQFLNPNTIEIRVADGYNFGVVRYNKDGTYVGAWNGVGWGTSATGYWRSRPFTFYTLPDAKDYLYRVAMRKSDDTDIAGTAGSNVGIYLRYGTDVLDSNLVTMFASSSGEFAVLDRITGTARLQQGAIDSTGADTNQTSYTNNSYRTTGFVETQHAGFVMSSVTQANTTSFYHYVCFYDSAYTFISREGGHKWYTVNAAVPSNAYYYRVSLTQITDENYGINNITSYVNEIRNRHYGKCSPVNKWYVLGDSISAGYYSMTQSMADAAGLTLDYVSPVTTTGGETTGSVWDSSLAHNYWGYANQWKLQRTLVGKAYPGQGYIRQSANDQNGIYVVKNNDFSDAGLITVAWGFNDWHYNGMNRGSGTYTIGDHTLINPNVPFPTNGTDISQIVTFNQAVWYCLGLLIAKAPQAKIVVQTPMNGWAYGGSFGGNWALGYSMSVTQTLTRIHDDIVYWANYYGLQILDMTYNNSVVNRRNIRDSLIDGSHPSDEAHKQLGRTVAEQLGYC